MNRERVFHFFKHPLTILSVALLGMVFILLSFALSPSKEPEIPAPPIEQPTLFPTSPQDIPEREIVATPAFTQEEQTYPNATPQEFPKLDGSHAGALTVTSNPPTVQVVLQSADGTITELPSNSTPFKAVGIPAGNYTISATAEGYESTTLPLLIMEGEVNRFFIELKPLQQTQ